MVEWFLQSLTINHLAMTCVFTGLNPAPSNICLIYCNYSCWKGHKITTTLTFYRNIHKLMQVIHELYTNIFYQLIFREAFYGMTMQIWQWTPSSFKIQWGLPTFKLPITGLLFYWFFRFGMWNQPIGKHWLGIFWSGRLRYFDPSIKVKLG